MAGITTVLILLLLNVLQIYTTNIKAESSGNAIHGEWNLFMKKCWSGRDDSATSSYNIGNVKQKFGLNHEQLIKESTVIKATGFFEVYTKAASQQKSTIYLTAVNEDGGKKFYKGSLSQDASIGWGSQSTKIEVSLTIDSEGNAYLKNYVYAGSWGSISCSHANSKISAIIITA